MFIFCCCLFISISTYTVYSIDYRSKPDHDQIILAGVLETLSTFFSSNILSSKRKILMNGVVCDWFFEDRWDTSKLSNNKESEEVCKERPAAVIDGEMAGNKRFHLAMMFLQRTMAFQLHDTTSPFLAGLTMLNWPIRKMTVAKMELVGWDFDVHWRCKSYVATNRKAKLKLSQD